MAEQLALAIAAAKPVSALPLTIVRIREKLSMPRCGVNFRDHAITITAPRYPDGTGGVFVAIQAGHVRLLVRHGEGTCRQKRVYNVGA